MHKQSKLYGLMGFLFILNLTVFSQQSLTRKVSNLPGNKYIASKISFTPNNQILFSYPINTRIETGVDSIINLFLDPNTLAVEDSVISYGRLPGDSTYLNTFVQRDKNGQLYLLEIGNSFPTNSFTLTAYKSNTPYEKTKLIHSDTIENEIFHSFGFINNHWVILSSRDFPLDGVLVLKSYDLAWNNIQQKVHFAKNEKFWKRHGLQIIGEHPLDSNTFIVKETTDYSTFFMNLKTLELTKSIATSATGIKADIMNKHRFSTFYIHNTQITDTGLVLYGSGHLMTSLQPVIFKWQYLVVSLNWDRTYQLVHLGDSNINHKAYASTYNNVQKTTVIAGSYPFNQGPLLADEQRSVLIYIYDNYGKKDSLELFGDLNHVPNSTLIADNGDVYLSGSYSNAWSNKHSYAWLTKIPGIATSLVEQKAITNQLHLYPNPCSNELRVDIETNFASNNYRIYNQTGQVIQAGTLTNNAINTAHLAKGSYILVIESEGLPPHNALFVKQ